MTKNTEIDDYCESTINIIASVLNGIFELNFIKKEPL